MNNHISFKSSESFSPQVMVLKVAHHVIKNNNYLIVDPITHRAVIVDPAWQMDVIEQALADAQASLSGILLTHSHPDHIHLAKPLAEKYQCPIWMSKQEIATSGFYAEQLIAIDETPWLVGAMKIQPILTPGHTPGCVCYRIGDNLFTGDVLFAEGCGICPDVDAAHAMFISLEKLKTVLPPQTRIFPGHTYVKQPGQFFSQLLRDNMYLQFPTKEMFAGYRLRSGQSAAKMFSFS